MPPGGRRSSCNCGVRFGRRRDWDPRSFDGLPLILRMAGGTGRYRIREVGKPGMWLWVGSEQVVFMFRCMTPAHGKYIEEGIPMSGCSNAIV